MRAQRLSQRRRLWFKCRGSGTHDVSMAVDGFLRAALSAVASMRRSQRGSCQCCEPVMECTTRLVPVSRASYDCGNASERTSGMECTMSTFSCWGHQRPAATAAAISTQHHSVLTARCASRVCPVSFSAIAHGSHLLRVTSSLSTARCDSLHLSLRLPLMPIMMT